jgi:hypothetical protein
LPFHFSLFTFYFCLFTSERSDVTLEEFQQRVRQQFGAGMERATPENVREFLDQMQQELDPQSPGSPLELDETETSYEAILRAFFSEILETPRDQAVIQLWLLSLELAFADLRDTIEQEISPLFSPWEESP